MINIVSGQQFINNKEKFGIEGKVISFNEAMVDGNVIDNIFSDEFLKERCKTHNISINEYEKITISPLKNINNYSSVNMYFGFDMFCQINLLTLLAYFDQIKFNPEIRIYICDEVNLKVIDTYNTSSHGYYSLFKEIIIKKNYIETNNKYLNDTLNYYFNYINKNKMVIKELLSECSSVDEYDQVCYLINNDTLYGLGDIQWVKWLKALK